MEQEQANSIIENLSGAFRRSVTVKLISIFVLMLLLMIPMAFVKSLINERDSLSKSVTYEVSDKWANEQKVYGPVLTIPFNEKYEIDNKVHNIRKEAHLLPSSLVINGNVTPETLRRGIYEVVVYNSDITFTGSFSDLESYTEQLQEYEILWKEAFLTINISDLRGIQKKVTVNWNDSEKQVKPGTAIPEMIKSGVTVTDIFDESPDSDSIDFSFDLNLQGSQYLGFIPLGKETDVRLSSNWKDPSFTGSFLPDERTVNDDGFTSEYKILELNRNYPQFWIGNRNIQNISESAFGVDLLIPVNDYQKSMRSAKYALLAISLTFLTFFLVEIFNKQHVHPFQYILIGLALCLFYTLLVSITEHANFDVAYLISSISVISMIGLYTKSILSNLKQAILLVFILGLTYTFVYITLQIQDYALLIGSIGLTAILALTMFITRNINWYELGTTHKAETSLSS
jgi:inner membrane protein